MKEILAQGLDLAMYEMRFAARKAYEEQREEGFQIWQMSENELDKISDIEDADWRERYGFWVYTEGTDLGKPKHKTKINGYKITAYNEQNISEYANLREYLKVAMNATEPEKICAVCVDLAKYNNMTMAELWTKYQG